MFKQFRKVKDQTYNNVSELRIPKTVTSAVLSLWEAHLSCRIHAGQTIILLLAVRTTSGERVQMGGLPFASNFSPSFVHHNARPTQD